MNNDTSPHQSHCCAKHGCKYNNDDCPVATGQVKQDYPCEDCAHSECAVILRDRLYTHSGDVQVTVVKVIYGYGAYKQADDLVAAKPREEGCGHIDNFVAQRTDLEESEG